MKKKYNFPLKFKAVIIIIALSIILCAVSIAMSSIRFSKTNEENFKNQCRDLAHTVALTIDGDDLHKVTERVHEIFQSIPEDELITSDEWGSDEFNAYLENYKPIFDMPEYKNVLKELRQTQELGISTLSSVYTCYYTKTKSGTYYAVYLVDAAFDDPCPPGVVEHVEEAPWEIINDPSIETEPYITNTEMYGWLVTGLAPVYDSNGEFAGYATIDLSMDEIKAKESSFIQVLTLLLIILTAIICIVTLVIIDFSVIRPVNKLSNVATGYIDGNENRDKFASLDIRRSDEIGNLSDAMKKMEKDLGTYIDDLTAVTAEKERVSAELNVATRIQEDMLPKDFPERNDISLYAAMTPAKEVGGDFYDFFFVDDDHIALVIADVSGKGVPAALFSVVSKVVIRNQVHAGGTPAEVLERTNSILCSNNGSGLFVTVWLGILDLKTGDVEYVNAGHEYPIISPKDKHAEIIEKDSFPPLAAMEGIEYINERLHLNNGDNLILYTDGVPEAKAADGSRFGMDRLVEIVERNKGSAPEKLVNDIKKDVDDFQSDKDPFDDVTIMSIIWRDEE